MTQKTSPSGRAFIRGFESCELEAYPDPGSPLAKECRRLGLKPAQYRQVPGGSAAYPGRPWTVGWGHTGPDVYPGLTITAERAETLFEADVAEIEAGVHRLVTRPLNQNQFDALVSFAFNCGLDEDNDIMPEGLGDSTLLKYINQGKFQLAASEFLKWNKSNGTVIIGLVRRRRAESETFLKPLESSHE